MSFLDYLKKLDRLDEIEAKLKSSNGKLGPEKYTILERLEDLRKRYEIAILEEGDYPRF